MTYEVTIKIKAADWIGVRAAMNDVFRTKMQNEPSEHQERIGGGINGAAWKATLDIVRVNK